MLLKTAYFYDRIIVARLVLCLVNIYSENDMKSIYLLATKLWVYLTEIPVLILLWVAISSNHLSDDIFKYYPLIIFLCFAVIFIMVYFFRVISLSTDEIRYHGLFSSKDSAFIKENRTLIMTLKPHREIRMELYGDAGVEPPFDWMKTEDAIHRDICLFRGRANGGDATVKKILKFYSLPYDKLYEAISDGFNFEDDNIQVESYEKDEFITVKLKFKTTQI